MIKLKEYYGGNDIAVFYRGKEIYRGSFTRALTITVKDYIIRDRAFRSDVVNYCNSFGDPLVSERDNAYDIADAFHQLVFAELNDYGDDGCVGNESGTIEVCTVDQIDEATHRTLNPQYDSRKSFYGKAHVVDDSDGSQILYSYDTPVCKINDRGEVELLSMWDSSQTTLRHVKEFLQQNGFKVGSKSQIAAMYGKKVERFSRKRGRVVREAKHARIIERQLNEGPGAGYTIEVDGLSDINVNSANVTEYVDEVGWYVDVDGTCNIDNLSANSYYYGTGYLYNVPAKITKVFVNWYWVDEYDDLSEMDEDELARFMTSYIKDRLDDTKFETVYGGGWMHSTYDGTIDAIDSERGDIDLVITDQDIINYIDIAVQGENTYSEYRIMCNDTFNGEVYEDEDEAIEEAKRQFYSQADGIDDLDYDIFEDGDNYQVVKTTGYYYYNGDIDDYSEDEVVWDSADLEFED